MHTGVTKPDLTETHEQSNLKLHECLPLGFELSSTISVWLCDIKVAKYTVQLHQPHYWPLNNCAHQMLLATVKAWLPVTREYYFSFLTVMCISVPTAAFVFLFDKPIKTHRFSDFKRTGMSRGSF